MVSVGKGHGLFGSEHTTTKHAIAHLDPDEPYLWLRPRKPRQPSLSFQHFLNTQIIFIPSHDSDGVKDR